MAARIVLSWFLLVGLTGCHSRPMFEAKQKLVVADAQQAAYSLIYIAEAKGFFDQEGVTVEFRKFNIGKDALNDLLSGNSDVATVYSSPVIFQALAGREVNILGTLHRSARNTAILARTDRGIHNLENLIGKKIGLTKSTSSEYFLDLLFTAEGLDSKSVQLVDIKVDDLITALERGEVDAIVAWGVYLAKARKRFPNQQSMMFYSEIYPETSVIAVSPAFLAKHPDTAERFVKALVKAEDYYARHRHEAYDIIKKRLQPMNADDVQVSLEASQIMIRIDNALLYGMNDEARWIARMRGKSETLPLFESRIRPSFLEKAQPLSVTLPISK